MYKILKQASILRISTKRISAHALSSFKQKVSLSFNIYGNESGASEVPIFILHDVLCNKKMWKGLAKTLVALTKRPVVTFDLRNHGKSKHYKSHTYEDMASDVLEMYKRTSIDKAILLGHGMGGRTAMTIALKHPQKVACLLILDISPVSTTEHMYEFYPRVMKAMKGIKFKKLDYYAARKLVKREIGKLCEDKIELKAIVSNLSSTDRGKVRWKCNLDALIKNFDNIANYNPGDNQFSGPALFLGGQHSEYIPADDLTGIRDLFPNSVVLFIPKTGHFLHFEEPFACLEFILNFLALHQFENTSNS